MAGFVERLRSAAYRFCVRLLASANGDFGELEHPGPWDAANLLEPDDKGDKDQDIRFLRLQLTKLRADNTELQSRVDDWRTRFPALLNMTECQLHELARHYDIWQADDAAGWFVAANNCVFCGCGLEIETFRTRRDALLYGALLHTVGYRPRHNLSCPSCYAEYEETHEISIE